MNSPNSPNFNEQSQYNVLGVLSIEKVTQKVTLKGEYNMINKTANKGFTLVEIMIVVVIIGLLAAMAIPAFNKVRATSQDKAVTNNLRQYASAAQQYMLDAGVSVVDYSDIVGSGLHISVLDNVADETYTGLTLGTNTTRLQATVNGRIINYSF